jgi:hypothetical protein
MDPKLIILFVLAVVVVIGAGIFFQDRNRPPGGEDSNDGPDAPDNDGPSEGGSGSGDSESGGGD